MRVLVCGSRDWTDDLIIGVCLDGLLGDSVAEFDYPLVVIDGGARGADAAAAAWYGGAEDGVHAIHEQVLHEQYPADWDNLPRWEAGPMRNQQMLDEGKPDLVLAFKDGFQRDEFVVHDLGGHQHKGKGGTEDMVRRAKAAGVPVYVVSHG